MNAVQSRRLTQEMEDTYRRALTGGPFYLLAWLIVGIYGDAFARTPMASWILAFVFAALAGMRFLHRPIADAGGHADDAARVRWLRLHWGIVALTTLLWGAVFCWTLLDPGFGNARTASLLSTLGLATAVAHAFSMRRGFALACIALLYAPGLLVLWANPADRATALVMVVYLAYVLISLVRSHAEYQQRLDLDQELRDQRDLFSQQSKIDPLTELANRRHFSNVLAEGSERALRTGGPLTLLVLDLDHFKKINDTHGHAIGDACLVAIAGRLRTLFSGEDDLPARLGGEEFGVVLDRQDLAAAARRAEHFRANLAEHPIALHGSTLDGNALDGMVLAMTASIGIAEFDSAVHRDVDDLYSAADRAVYRAKAAGRNRVCADEPALAMAGKHTLIVFADKTFGRRFASTAPFTSRIQHESMKPIAALLRRYSVTLFLAGIAILATTTIVQTVRLRYLEQRHHDMLRDFGKARMELQNKVNELAAGCAASAGR